MKVFLEIGMLKIPMYGLMIVLGGIIANAIAAYIVKKKSLDIYHFIILEAYCVLGGFLGAKALYLITSAKRIDWSRMTSDFQYFNDVMRGGFVFYGGVIGGLLFLIMAWKIHGINPSKYVENLIFLIPFMHAFGRIGCFCAGCCYGRPYDGWGAVVFPENSFAIPGIKLFPVQIVEAIILFFISMIILFLQIKLKWNYNLEVYFILYGIARFFLEYCRYDGIRGIYYGVSTSQWISIILIVIAIVMIIYKRKNKSA